MRVPDSRPASSRRRAGAAAALAVAVLAAGSAGALAAGSDPAPADPDGAAALCPPLRDAEGCVDGGGRTTPGGGDTGKVSHAGWPKVTGILWKVNDSRDSTKTGGARNDELLGHHGSDRMIGKGGKDILWGDWDPKNNGTKQVDVLDGGAGNDWLYSSHGRNVIRGGAGNDYVWAYYGRGTIDCGPGKDTLRVRLENDYTYRNCETIKNFCAFGSKPGGGCYKPGEKPKAARVRAARPAPAAAR
ncbi:calcium-binding protein [Patulibacter sp. NPDC049589]|uniref:calcium-binding protein n=1 Tax=Patulibacter sp. NPDC049589 TaxID=3154731 RepID=UPI003447A12D